MVEQVRTHASSTPRPTQLDAGEPVLSLEMYECFLRRHRAGGLGEPADRGGESLRLRRLPREVRLAQCGAEERVVTPRDEMKRLTNHRGLDHGATCELALERFAPEARRACPDADVRRRRPLRLHSDEAFDHRSRRQPLPLEQELPRECRAAQLASCENALGHVSTPHSASSGLLFRRACGRPRAQARAREVSRHAGAPRPSPFRRCLPVGAPARHPRSRIRLLAAA